MTNETETKMLTEEELQDLINKEEVISNITSKFQEAKDGRLETERKWLAAKRAYRGEYNSEETSSLNRMRQKNPNSSGVFIKVTKTKTQAAYAQILEVLLGNTGRFPLTVEPTPVPEGIAEVAHIGDSSVDTSSNIPYADVYGYPGDGNDLAPGATSYSLLNGLGKQLKSLLNGKSMKVGPSPDKTTMPEVYPALEAAKRAEKLLQDQLAENHAEFALRRAALECAMLGTGIVKGPYSIKEVIHKYEQDPQTKSIAYKPVTKLTPKIVDVSVWNVYPDPHALRVEDSEYVIERHLMTKSQVRNLVNMTSFDKSAVIELLKMDPTHGEEYWETELQDNTNVNNINNRYEVLEYWGAMDVDLAKSIGMELDDDDDLLDQLSVNLWISNGLILRAVVNPFTPNRTPYHFVPYEEHPYQIWGVGVPENMSDPQALINGHMRMAIDNLKLAGNLVFEVDERNYRPGETMEMYAGKVLRKIAGAPGQSVTGISFPNTAESHIRMVQVAQQLADQQTLPSVTHGQAGISGVGRTASGISMLLGAAALSIKNVVRNFDHYLITPLGEALYQWNAQFNESELEVIGDVKILANGVSSLMKREILSQRLIAFVQMASANPNTAPLINTQYLLKEIARSMDLDTEKAVNDLDTAKLMAEIIGQQSPKGQQQVPNELSMPGQQSSINNELGIPAVPGEQGFSGPAMEGPQGI